MKDVNYSPVNALHSLAPLPPLPRRHRLGINRQAVPPSFASVSNPSNTVSPGVIFRYHQHQPSLTNS